MVRGMDRRRKPRDHSGIQAFYDAGHTVEETAEHFGCGVMTLHKDVRLGLLRTRPRNAKNESKRLVPEVDRIQKIVSLYAAGSSIKEILAIGFRSCEYIYARRMGLLIARSRRNAAIASRLKYPAPRMSDVARRGLAERQSLRNTGGRCRWYEVAGQKVQGTWERDIALAFERCGLRWRKLAVGRDVIWYERDGATHSYTPDFHLPDYDILVEVKGYWWGDDRRKMSLVTEQHPDKPIVVLSRESYLDAVRDPLSWLNSLQIAKVAHW